MRFDDWDVLLFPGIGREAHIPVQEFGVECYSVTDNRLLVDEHGHPDTISVPLMTAFVPSLVAGHPFQISLHSWKPKPFTFRPAHPERTSSAEQVWQCKVSIDGQVMCADTMTADVQWPKVIHLATAREGRACGADGPDQLRFPPFDHACLQEQHWHPYADKGRIKVEISEGFLEKTRNGQEAEFVKLEVHVIFNFQHAPIDVLKASGKAWPSLTIPDSKHVWAPHLMSGMPEHPHTADAMEPERFRHHSAIPRKKDPRRRDSGASAFFSSPPMSGMLPGLPPPTPGYGPLGHPTQAMRDRDPSGSTSAYSTISQSSMPLSMGGGMMHLMSGLPVVGPYPGMQPMASTGSLPPFNPDLEVHVPNGQLAKVVDLLERRAQGSVMAPPPLPPHILNANANVQKVEDLAAVQKVEARDGDEDVFGCRGSSRAGYSDVSMHAGCAEFPRCTTEDDDGNILHHQDPGLAPAADIYGRKERLAERAERDFFSSIVDADKLQSPLEEDDTSAPTRLTADRDEYSRADAADTGSKRSRAALKTLTVKDTGSPERQEKGKVESEVDAKPARKLRKRSGVVEHGKVEDV